MKKRFSFLVMSKYFQKLVRIFFYFLVFILAALAVFVFYARQTGQITPLPESEQPVSKIGEFEGGAARDFRWSYGGSEYFLELALYESAYTYYKNRDKFFRYQGPDLPADWKEQYYGMFLEPAENDRTFEELAGLIMREGEKKKLSRDEIAELALAFVQSIPYDSRRAAAILNSSASAGDPETLPKYPYEILYEQKGICSDKSFLAAALFRELGFGTALFEYENANHMAAGIQCPPEYSTENSGYCYAETTTPGHKIGIVPELDRSSGRAVAREEKEYYAAEESRLPAPLVSPGLYRQLPGLVYAGVQKTYAIQAQISEAEKKLASLSAELSVLKKQADALEKEINELKKDLERYEKEEKYEKYNKLVPGYNKLVEDYRDLIKKYNAKVSEYNAQIKNYNSLIKKFSL